MKHSSNPLDAEIRRAMGELANAAPPARPPESFGTELEPLTTSGGSDPNSFRGWLLAAAATVLVAVVGATLVVVTSDETTTISDTPVTVGPEVEPLTGDALVSELADRRWVALERFDDPSPTARTPEFTVTKTTGEVTIDGFDGCFDFAGSLDLTGDALGDGLGDGGISFGTGPCEVPTLESGARLTLIGGSIELEPGAATLLLVDPDGSPLARFHDLDLLTPASADDMPYTFFGDNLDTVTFTVSGVGVTACTRFSWEDAGDGVTVSFLEALNSCSADDVAIVGWMIDITADGGADVYVTPGGLLLADASSTLQLLLPPEVAIDPDGVTLAAEVIFGIEPGPGVSPDDVLEAVVPHLGQPDLDTGWVPMEQLTSDVMDPIFSPCAETLSNYRELWWGDLSFGFWGAGSRTDLQFWNVGDRRLIFSPDTPGTPPTTASGLTTEAGVGIGDAAATIPDSFATAGDWNVGAADRFAPGTLVWKVVVASADRGTPANTTAAFRSGSYLVANGVVVAFGSNPFTC